MDTEHSWIAAYIRGLPSEGGTYSLILSCEGGGVVEIGSLGRLGLREGYYVYVGSAFGSGGLRARLGHHLRLMRRPHWHIDYLRRGAVMREIWFAAGAVRHEHRWAGIVASLPGAQVPMARFGSSDCACAAHLFYFREPPTHDGFALAAGRTVKRVAIE